MVSIEWTQEANFDFNEILAYLSNASPQYAHALFEKVKDALVNLKKFPKLGRKVPESDNENDRELIIQKYRLIYRFVEDVDKIFVLMIIHGSRILNF
ncbi:type II toxin-antitoxin system RelE/ParE family toxin [Promethearchaeum syntrophicum]|uniref:Type II toxin-antitoxin system RelE/ParE family toxin n=1 Tax=Promethearchaeum syntrophicum TaxID=2594042 RepID=A0A5B9DBA7_9ARCH|nr:type II toxin-antitoxin system RelE/ParE family toxin [Candidatus Prometheoarchaeum syntrophicum]QEE16382.1 Plasmid stabilization system protein [Candidatus Prometheoarchaeum syntrophicum]